MCTSLNSVPVFAYVDSLYGYRVTPIEVSYLVMKKKKFIHKSGTDFRHFFTSTWIWFSKKSRCSHNFVNTSELSQPLWYPVCVTRVESTKIYFLNHIKSPKTQLHSLQTSLWLFTRVKHEILRFILKFTFNINVEERKKKKILTMFSTHLLLDSTPHLLSAKFDKPIGFTMLISSTFNSTDSYFLRNQNCVIYTVSVLM